MTDKEKYDFIDHVVHLTLLEEDRLLEEHGGDYSGLEEDGIDSNEYYRIITEKVINILKMNNNYMQEEPVSEELDEAANNALNNVLNAHEIVNIRSCLEMFKYGAKWQKEQDQSTIELAEDHAMLAGMEKMKEQMMAKAIDVEVKVGAGGYPYIPPIELYDYDRDIPLAKMGDKYKVVLIKED